MNHIIAPGLGTEGTIKFTKFELVRKIWNQDTETVTEVYIDCGEVTLILSREEVLKILLWTGITR